MYANTEQFREDTAGRTAMPGELFAIDLSSTRLAQAGPEGFMPNQLELFAVLLALLDGIEVGSASGECIVVSMECDDLGAVVKIIHAEFPLFFQRVTSLPAMRKCLAWLVGIRFLMLTA